MAKAQSPVRLEASLMKSAAIAGDVFKRSAVEQVEYWAAIGRVVDPTITANDLLALKAGLIQVKLEKKKGVFVDAPSLLAEIDATRQSGSLQDDIAPNFPKYQASIAYPGYLEQVSDDGRIVVGQFEDGAFKAVK